MLRGIRTCTLTSALALIGLAASCTNEEPATPAAQPAASAPANAGTAPAPADASPATTAPDGAGASDAATTPGAPGTPEAAATIRARAQRLWDAKVNEDWASVYDLRDPSVRNEGTQEEYVAWAKESEPFRIEGYTLGEVLVEDHMAWVQVDAKMSTRRFATPARDVKRWDKWRFVEGQDWYPVPQKLLEAYPVSPVLRDREEEERLRARFMISWEARKNRDWQGYLDMYAPDDREIMTLEEFSKINEMFIYEACEVRWVEVIRDRGHVRVAITERVTDPSLSKMPAQLAVATERWTKVGGEWYLDLGATPAPAQSQTRGGK